MPQRSFCHPRLDNHQALFGNLYPLKSSEAFFLLDRSYDKERGKKTRERKERMAPEKPAHLEPSKLGTKEYWDALYSSEIANHAHDPTDTGTAWFDDSDATERLVDFLEDAVEDGSLDCEEKKFVLDKNTTTFLDLGTGNGSLLFRLRDAGWEGGYMLGVDYSPLSVEFARRIERGRRKTREEEQEQDQDQDQDQKEEGKEEEEEEDVEVHFAEHDILHTPASALLDLASSYSSLSSSSSSSSINGTKEQFPGFDIVLDKGTFDAISLSDETIPSSPSPSPTTSSESSSSGNRRRRIHETYASRVLPLVRDDGGLFIVTSCNWTEAELRAWFEDESSTTSSYTFRVIGRVEYPSFSFGGVKGQTISTLCFRKVRKENPRVEI
ncbi:hypothetical protein F5Y17DRAFT_423964 [Xylariaceae sp. FL0594]|nr:hypothetical protein F5Y17DRAFT_423964 [Xylariaceae sp. FL0594]